MMYINPQSDPVLFEVKALLVSENWVLVCNLPPPFLLTWISERWTLKTSCFLELSVVALTCSTLQWSRQWSSCLPGRSDEGPPHNSRERPLHGKWEENNIACLGHGSLEWKTRSLSWCREAKQDVWAQLWYRLVLQHFSRILCFSCNTGTMHFYFCGAVWDSLTLHLGSWDKTSC